jgi:pimeloyl-ACP methyl ester carboxylesterase
VTFGRRDPVCSTRFADGLTRGIAGAELVLFEDCAHAPIYQNVKAFNARTLAFLQLADAVGNGSSTRRSR